MLPEVPVSSPARTENPHADWERTGVRLDIADATATVTLCRPERRNAQSPALWRALAGIEVSAPFVGDRYWKLRHP